MYMSSKLYFFVGLLLLGVLMSAMNIRDAMNLLPDNGDTLDEINWSDQKKLLEKTDAVTNSNRIIKKDLPITVAFNGVIPNKESSTDVSINTTMMEDLRFAADFESVTPNNNNTVISLISMGRLVDTILVERCILSIRRRGLYSGTILLFTDNIGYQRYQSSILPWDNRTKIIQGKDLDLIPIEDIKEDREKNIAISSAEEIQQNHQQNQSRPKKYAQETMIYKRFKTHHKKYIAEDPIMNSTIRYVLYIDVDNIIGSPLSIFFQDYVRTVTEELEQISNDIKFRDLSFISMFKDKHLRGKMHSGVILFDLLHQDRCVDGWRNEMDSFWHASDQTMLLRVLDNYSRYHCRVFSLIHGHLAFPNKRLMIDATNANMNSNMIKEGKKRRRKGRENALVLPTFVHMTNFRVKKINNATIHEGFVRYALDVKDNDTFIDGIKWKQIVSPTVKRITEG
mmetsp:Transcript_32347/g.37057  ORF Transcript_32347/g.37057 Transcript_32347/m.37057 type:complete len:453 (-) Transcript_32347:133-1491(-)